MYYCKNCGHKFERPIEIKEIFGYLDACPRCRVAGYIEELDEDESEEE